MMMVLMGVFQACRQVLLTALQTDVQPGRPHFADLPVRVAPDMDRNLGAIQMPVIGALVLLPEVSHLILLLQVGIGNLL